MKRYSILDYELTPTNLKELLERLIFTQQNSPCPSETRDFSDEVIGWIDELMTKVENKCI